MSSPIRRCDWSGSDPLMQRYHDEQWGVPVHRDRLHFEMLILEGAQAGLQWRTILHKRTGYRRAFANFDPRKEWVELPTTATKTTVTTYH